MCKEKLCALCACGYSLCASIRFSNTSNANHRTSKLMPHSTHRDSEIELIICCSRLSMDAATEERIKRIIRNKPDWDFVLETSLRHGVDVLLYRSLGHVNSDGIPPAVHSRLRKQVQQNVVNCLFLTAQLLNLLELFHQSGIDAIPFKGPALAVSAYGDVTFRRFGDLDILIRKKDFARTKELLLGRGFRPWRELTPLEEAAHIASKHAFTFVSDHAKVAVDLHWDLLQKRFAVVETENLWKRLTPLSIAGREILGLKPEDLFLYLCLHGAKHGWKRLAWICDVAEFVRAQPNMEWNFVWEQAKQLRCGRVLLVGMCLAKETVGIDLPEAVAKRIDRRMLVTALSLRNRVFADHLPYREVAGRIASYANMRERWRDRIPYIRHALGLFLRPNRKDRELCPLPIALTYLHYVFRPLRLIAILSWQTAAPLFGRTSNHRPRSKN